MFLIAGFGHKSKKDYGPVLTKACPRCNNSTAWRLIKATSWFTLFFIPLIPYSTKKILACPIAEPNAKGRRMFIPKGEWYNFWDDELNIGGEEVWVDADLDSMPIFVKAGAIIPKYPIQQYVGEKQIDQLVLDVYYKNGKETSQVYEDAHDGYDYKKGRFSLRDLKLIGKKKSLTIQQFKSGKYTTPYDTFKINLKGLPFKIAKIEIDHEVLDLRKVKINGDNSFVVTKEFNRLHITGK